MHGITYSSEQLVVRALAKKRHLVVAPPGSGKTQLLAARLMDALQQGLEPESMTCLTFTNRAARNMAARVQELTRTVCIGNVHACAIHLLKRGGFLPWNTTVLDEVDRRVLLGLAIDRVDQNNPRGGRATSIEDDPLVEHLERRAPELLESLGLQLATGPRGLRPSIWSGRAELLKWVERHLYGYCAVRTCLSECFPDAVREEALARFSGSADIHPGQEPHGVSWIQAIQLAGLEAVRESFLCVKHETAAVDFDDLLSLLLTRLVSQPSEWPSASMTWVQLDEAQDFNAIQWAIIERLTAKHACVVAFADPQQGIFSFIGAEPRVLDRHAGGYQHITLSRNFRSPPALVGMFSRYRSKHFGTADEWSASAAGAREDSPLVYLQCASTHQERHLIATRLMDVCDHRNKSVAVLLRTNNEVCDVSDALAGYNIQHFRVSQFDLFERSATKDFMAYLSALANPLARMPWVRVVRQAMGQVSLKESLAFVNRACASGVLPHWLLCERPSPDYSPATWLRERLGSGRIVVFDTETTGLDVLNDDIIQFAAVELIDGRPRQRLNMFLRTEQDLAASEGVHGVSRAVLDEQGIDPAEGLERALEFIGDSLVCAHNLAFDRRILAMNAVRRLGASGNVVPDGVCTREIATARDPTAPSHSLSALIDRYGIAGINSHDAEDDVAATVGLAQYLARESDGHESREFVAAHGEWIERLRGYMQGELLWRDECYANEVSFEDLLERFLGLGQQYPSEHIKEIRQKLIRHMQTRCGTKPLERLLADDLPPYLLFSEPDLILESDTVVVSTIHRAKGLEFDSVIVPNVHDESFPGYHARSSRCAARIAEEARLLYVAMTRAKRRLVIVHPRQYTNGYGTWPAHGATGVSPFLKDVLHCFESDIS